MSRHDDPLVPTYADVPAALRSAYLADCAEVWGMTPEPEDFGARGDKDDPEALASWADVEVEDVLDYLDGSPSDSWADDLNQYEWLAQAVWTRNAVRGLLCPRLLTTIDARYLVAIDPDEVPSADRRKREPHYWGEVRLYNAQLTQKRTACHRLAGMVAKAGTYGRPDRAYTLDRVHAWAGLESTVDSEWSVALGKDVRTLLRWRTGRGTFGPGIECTLNAWLDDAHEALREPMEASGLVVRWDASDCYTVNMHSIRASA